MAEVVEMDAGKIRLFAGAGECFLDGARANGCILVPHENEAMPGHRLGAQDVGGLLAEIHELVLEQRPTASLEACSFGFAGREDDARGPCVPSHPLAPKAADFPHAEPGEYGEGDQRSKPTDSLGRQLCLFLPRQDYVPSLHRERLHARARVVCEDGSDAGDCGFPDGAVEHDRGVTDSLVDGAGGEAASQHFPLPLFEVKPRKGCHVGFRKAAREVADEDGAEIVVGIVPVEIKEVIGEAREGGVGGVGRIRFAGGDEGALFLFGSRHHGKDAGGRRFRVALLVYAIRGASLVTLGFDACGVTASCPKIQLNPEFLSWSSES